MKEIGYGLLKNKETPVGIWPQSFESQKKALFRYHKADANGTFQIVPVYIGTPISVLQEKENG